MRSLAAVAAAALMAIPLSAAGPANAPTSHSAAVANAGYVAHHARSAVHWNEWSAATFAHARRANKLLFVSIGFTGCRECEAMHRDAFAASDVAKLLNSDFVPVLVDSDEHPDVAAAGEAYVRSTKPDAALPINIVFSPDLWPVAGSGSMNRFDLHALLDTTGKRWATQSEAMMREASANVARALKLDAIAAEPMAKPGEALVAAVRKASDAANGSAAAPRSLAPIVLDALLRRAAAGDAAARDLAFLTLNGILRGGIYDRVAGGFFPRSLDDAWRFPVFGKRMTDQALMVIALTDALRLRHSSMDEDAIRRTLDYLVRDLRDQRGTLISGEGSESVVPAAGPHLVYGAYFTWALDEARRVAGTNADLVEYAFGLKASGNVPDAFDPHHELAGRNVLFAAVTSAEIQKRFGIATEEKAEAAIASSVDRMLFVRSHRPPPAFDDQSIAGWNGLAVSAFARAGAILDERSYVKMAREIAASLESRFFDRKSGRLIRRSGVDGLPDDYAFVVQGLIDVFDATHEVRWLELAIALQRKQDSLFWNAAAMRYVSDNALPPAVRDLAPDRDRDVPAANGVAAANLVRLSALTGDKELRTKADSIFRSFAYAMQDAPAAVASVTTAADAASHAPVVVIVTGNPGAADVKPLLASYFASPLPSSDVLVVRSAREQAELAKIAPLVASIHLTDTAGKPLAPGSTASPAAAAYVCRGTECGTAITDPAVLTATLQKSAQ